MGTKLLELSVERGFGGSKGVNPFTTGNPFLGTKLLGFSLGRGSGALKGLERSTQQRMETK